MSKAEERKAWIAFMAAAMTQYNLVAVAADKADMALALLKQRFPVLPANWQETLDPL